jgi:NAD(P)-dependent dehydrogenase (short-subunit alcohol dehydrogenase family)
MTRSFVVTGGARGVGRAIAERLAEDGAVVVVDTAASDGLGSGIRAIAGDASDDAVLGRAVQIAASSGTLSGWVNNAAVFRDAALHTSSAREVVELIAENLALAVAGSGAAVRRFLADGTAGAIVNVSSHQATRAVPGALPYATAKAAIEGLTRALAVDYGPRVFGPTRSRSARSSPSATTRTSTPPWRGCTRSAAPGTARRSPRSSRTCCRRQRASSTAPSCRSTAAALRWASIQRRGRSRAP